MRKARAEPVKGSHRNFYTAIFVKSGAWWAAYVAEVPGVNTQGKTLREARANVKDALRLVLKTNKEIAEKQAGPESLREIVAV